MDARLTIVGAGPAGLALAREPQRRGLRSVLLERGRVGEAWARQYGDLRLHVLAGAAALPGMPWSCASERFPSAPAMTAYLRAYAGRFVLDVSEGVTVQRAAPVGDGHGTAGAAPAGPAPVGRMPTGPAPNGLGTAPGWRLDTERGSWLTERLMMATGI